MIPRFPLRTLRSASRLAVGLARLPFALRRVTENTSADLISVDVFGTLLARFSSEDAVWREGALHAAEVARARGLQVDPDPLAMRRAVENALSHTLVASGRDPEFPHGNVLEKMLVAWGAGEWAGAVAEELAAWEVDREFACTRPVPNIAALVRRSIAAGKHVVAVSDSRYTGSEISSLLKRHGIEDLCEVYSSADFAASKFSGRLFDVVAQHENVPLAKIFHIGDNPITDSVSPAQRGIAVHTVRTRSASRLLPDAPVLSCEADSAFSVGYRTIGPALVAFTNLLFERARRDGIRRLSFVSRDGELLLQVAQALAPYSPSATDIELRYVHLSRRAVACASPDFQKLPNDPGAIDHLLAEIESVRGMGSPLQSFQSYFNLPEKLVSRHAQRLELARGDLNDVRRLLSDPVTAAELAEAMRSARELLRRYLVQEEILLASTALVDIGWRGSLQRILQSQSAEWGLAAPQGYYLGLWNESSSEFPARAFGLVSDQRRDRSSSERAAWDAAFLLEAICRASHGIVAGYRETTTGTIQPVHVEKGGTRESERESEKTQKRVKDGVLAYTQWYASSWARSAIDESSLRTEAQRRLHRLAFFPTAEECALGAALIYSEPTSDESALPLILSPQPGLRGWLHGLRSPWKGGYLCKHGGMLTSRLYALAESIFARLPGLKPAVRRMLVR